MWCGRFIREGKDENLLLLIGEWLLGARAFWRIYSAREELDYDSIERERG